MNIESERAAFEVWYETTYGISLEPEFRANHFIGYVNDKANHRWTAWQARAALSANHSEQVREGWKLVPVKPSIDMVESGYEASLGCPDRGSYARVIEQYDAMLSAAPSAGSQEQGE